MRSGLFNIFINDIDDSTLSRFADTKLGGLTGKVDDCSERSQEAGEMGTKEPHEFQQREVLLLGQNNLMHQHRLGVHWLESSSTENDLRVLGTWL